MSDETNIKTDGTAQELTLRQKLNEFITVMRESADTLEEMSKNFNHDRLLLAAIKGVVSAMDARLFQLYMETK